MFNFKWSNVFANMINFNCHVNKTKRRITQAETENGDFKRD